MGAVAVGVLVDGGLIEAAGGVAGDLSAFGGVLGQVSGDHGIGDRVVSPEGQRAYVELGSWNPSLEPCEKFLYVFKAALTGPHAPPSRQRRRLPLALPAVG
ncbi:hypothetical protein Mro03_42960 [Microbispora rosea subsp. rosea]|nr:hypothetical protein Mro03_42960 [Microbispora rosea subsp. rosea]